MYTHVVTLHHSFLFLEHHGNGTRTNRWQTPQWWLCNCQRIRNHLWWRSMFWKIQINLTELKGLNLLFFLSIYSPLWIFNSPHHQRIRTSRCRKFRQKTDTKIVTFANTSTKKVLNMTDMFSNVKNIFNWLFQTRRIPIFMNVNFVMALIFFEEQDCCINTSINSIQVNFTKT